ncbi:MAG: V-type ATPase subunit [Candidatus Heimdallarchaeaceae archaeon]
MIISDSTYLLARAHGIVGKVLTKAQLSLLLTSKNLVELRAAFTQTLYDEIIGDLNFETQLSDVARRLKNLFADLLVGFYKQSSSTSMKTKLQLFGEKYNAENLRVIIQSKRTNMDKESVVNRLIPVPGYSFAFYEKLFDKTVPEIISAQKNIELKRDLQRAYEEFLETERFTVLETAIDQYIYKLLPRISKFYKIYVNMKNILSICRCIALGIPAYRYILPSKFISKALSASTIQEVLQIYDYPPYSLVFSEYIDKKDIFLQDLEFSVERFLLKKWRRVFRFSNILKTDSIIGFLELKLAETMDIVRIIVGVNAGFSEQEIRDSLLFYDSF